MASVLRRRTHRLVVGCVFKICALFVRLLALALATDAVGGSQGGLSGGGEDQPASEGGAGEARRMREGSQEGTAGQQAQVRALSAKNARVRRVPERDGDLVLRGGNGGALETVAKNAAIGQAASNLVGGLRSRQLLSQQAE